MDNESQNENEVPSETPPSEGSAPETREDKRAERDFLRFKHEARELKEQNEKLMSQLENQKQNQMLEKEQFKELWESEKTKTQTLEEKNQELQSTFFGSLKQKEIEREAMKLGIRDEALKDLEILDNSSVITETTSQGNLNVIGASEFVEKLKQTRPYWFKAQGMPNVNTGNPTYEGPKKLSATDLLKLQKENPAKYQEEMMKRIGRK